MGGAWGQGYIHAVCVCLAPVHVYSQSDRCWTAIVMGFNLYWAALPSGGGDSLLEGCIAKLGRPGKDSNVQ